MKKVVVTNEEAYSVSFHFSGSDSDPVNSVKVLGDFNEWSHQNAFVLKRNAKGDFEGTFKIPAGREYHFRYLINGERWANEKNADRFDASPLYANVENSVLSLPALNAKKEAPAVKKEAPAKKSPAVKKAVPAKKEAPAKKTPAVKKVSPAKKEK